MLVCEPTVKSLVMSQKFSVRQAIIKENMKELLIDQIVVLLSWVDSLSRKKFHAKFTVGQTDLIDMTTISGYTS